MKSFKYLGGGILVGSVAILGFYLLSKETRIERLKRETNNMASEITVGAFLEMLLEDRKINIETAILIFENAQPGMNLDQFARSKTRDKEGYIKAYQKYFDKAQDILKN